MSMDRRPIRARTARWALSLAGFLAARGVRPNQISVTSVLFAALAGLALVIGSVTDGGWRSVLFLAAAGCIELRLLCNMLDGMVAIEGGLQTPAGVVFNELPDRLGDAATLVLAGYSLGGPDWASGLGWAAALTAVLTAYVRALGGSVGLAQDFGGPMAKPHRMQLMAGASVVAAVGSAVGPAGTSGVVIATALILVILGSAVTVARRTMGIISDLESARGDTSRGLKTGSG